MITVTIRDHESNKPGTYRCREIEMYGKTFVRRSSLPRLHVDLPRKVGDAVFSFSWNIKTQRYDVCAGEVKNVRYDSADGTVMISDGDRYKVWGKTVFPTRAEAEAALKAQEVSK